MKNGLHHPLWTHLPAFGALIATVIYIVRAWPLPERAAVHFGSDGVPNDYGSPWLVLGLTFGISLLMIGISTILDELWACQENRKTFNWLSLFDETTAGFMCGLASSYVVYLAKGAENFPFPWGYALAFTGLALALGIAVEVLRPFRGQVVGGNTPGVLQLSPELKERIKSGAPFIFWSSQNPAYVTLLTTLLPTILFLVAVLTYNTATWAGIEVAVIGLLLILPYGGLRIAVTRRDITIRFGLFGFRVLRLEIRDIIGSEAVKFSPLKDFGGYGIRFNREMKAYYLKGDTGVKLTTASGRKYLVGSDDAPLLAAVIAELSARKDIY